MVASGWPPRAGRKGFGVMSGAALVALSGETCSLLGPQPKLGMCLHPCYNTVVRRHTTVGRCDGPVHQAAFRPVHYSSAAGTWQVIEHHTSRSAQGFLDRGGTQHRGLFFLCHEPTASSSLSHLCLTILNPRAPLLPPR